MSQTNVYQDEHLPSCVPSLLLLLLAVAHIAATDQADLNAFQSSAKVETGSVTQHITVKVRFQKFVLNIYGMFLLQLQKCVDII